MKKELLNKKGPDVGDLEELKFSNLCLSLLQKMRKCALERTVMVWPYSICSRDYECGLVFQSVIPVEVLPV